MFPYHSYSSLFINGWWLNDSRVVSFLVCCKLIDFLLIVDSIKLGEDAKHTFLLLWCLIDQTTCRSAALRQAARNNHTTSKLIKYRSPRTHTALLLGERKYYHHVDEPQIECACRHYSLAVVVHPAGSVLYA
jgi:hypothetical protein